MKCKKNINLKEKMDEKKVYELFRLVKKLDRLGRDTSDMILLKSLIQWV